MEKVFAYVRVSSTGQAGEAKDGFPRQERAIRQYAQANKLEVVTVYREEFTGTEEYRPQLAKLMVSLEKNGHNIKTVLIEKLDRSSNPLKTGIETAARLMKNLQSITDGVHIMTVHAENHIPAILEIANL